MQTDNLVHMANRIGEFFQAMPDRAEALMGIADHLHKFWAPAMRHSLLAQLDAAPAQAPGDGGPLPIVREAVAKHRALLA